MAMSLIGLGSNLGPRTEIIRSAIEHLDALSGVRVVRCSRTYETVPAGGPLDQDLFLNAAAVLDTEQSAELLLDLLQGVETKLGRQHDVHWGARTIDLDLLLYEDLVCSTSDLVVPHPRMSFRRFVLEPACEIAPQMIHPTTRWSLARLLENIRSHRNYIAVTGSQAAERTRLIKTVRQRLGRQHGINIQMILSPQSGLPVDADDQDPAGLDQAGAIEFFRQRSDLLADARWPDPDVWLISDFWFREPCTTPDGRVAREHYEAYSRQSPQSGGKIITPKLLVVLDTGRRSSMTREGHLRDAHRSPAPAQPSAAELGNSGPLLSLAFSKRYEKQAAADEIVAAVLAMI
jgi:2-amino-4-hydroxy-6-hydroxymethyldihydropteridine diphosphokinase